MKKSANEMYYCLFTGIGKLVTRQEIFKLDILQIISQDGGQVQATSPEGGGGCPGSYRQHE